MSNLSAKMTDRRNESAPPEQEKGLSDDYGYRVVSACRSITAQWSTGRTPKLQESRSRRPGTTTMRNLPEVVSREQWLAARQELLVKEKELTRARDGVNADRRRLPMVRIDKPYTFEGPDGKVSLLDLFEGRPQLVMHHFMWINDIDADGVEHPRDAGCSSCSCAADQIPCRLRQLHGATASRLPSRKRSRMPLIWARVSGGQATAAVSVRTRALTRSGARRAARSDRKPPWEWPTRVACSTPRWSSRPSRPRTSEASM